VKDVYNGLTKDEPPRIIGFKVLAGFVMTRGPSIEDASVVCVATGSQCISGGHLSMEGETINDCHAEILARRCLVSYFYDQVELCTKSGSEESIFQASDSSQLLKLKDDIRFHLFISSAPCGDALRFTLNDTLQSPFEDLDPNRHGRGTLSTKIESGEGTVPVVHSTIQTWDGILQGERLVTMSCSDKVARWNVVGVQGSLLSHLIEPVYLQTIVVGSIFHQVHMHRALIGRIEHLKGLPSPYVFSRPVLLNTSTPPKRLTVCKSPKHSICWSRTWSQHEIIDVEKGKLIDGCSSKVSKKSLFKRFTEMASFKWEWRSIMETSCNNGTVVYQSVKRAARGFGEAKEMLQSALVMARLGQWIKKPLEQDTFDLPFEMSRSEIVQKSAERCPNLSSF